MRIRPFNFKVAHSLSEALELLSQSDPNAKILAGGTDLVLGLKKKTVQPDTLISLHPIRNLEHITVNKGVIQIGALAKHADLAKHPVLTEQVSILCQAVSLIGSWQIRNVSTIGGNLCNASPAADSAPPLLALDAELVVESQQKQRTIPISSFFQGPGKTTLGANEIMTEIRIKQPSNRSFGCYLKLRRRKAVDISLAGVAFHAELDESGQVLKTVRIALGGVAPTPIRVPDAENCLEGLSLDDACEKIATCADAAVSASQPIDDLRASANYKQTIVKAFTKQSAQHVLSILKNNGESS